MPSLDRVSKVGFNLILVQVFNHYCRTIVLIRRPIAAILQVYCRILTVFSNVLYHCIFIPAIKANAVGVASMSLGESVIGLPF